LLVEPLNQHASLAIMVTPCCSVLLLL